MTDGEWLPDMNPSTVTWTCLGLLKATWGSKEMGETELSSSPQRPRETSWLSHLALIEKVCQPLS